MTHQLVTSVTSPPSFLNPFCGPLHAYQSRVRPSSVYEVEDAVQSIRLREGEGCNSVIEVLDSRSLRLLCAYNLLGDPVCFQEIRWSQGQGPLGSQSRRDQTRIGVGAILCYYNAGRWQPETRIINNEDKESWTGVKDILQQAIYRIFKLSFGESSTLVS